MRLSSRSASTSRAPSAVLGGGGPRNPLQHPAARRRLTTRGPPSSSGSQLHRRGAAASSPSISGSVVSSSLSSSPSSSTPNDRSDKKKNKPVSIRLPIGPGDQADQAAAACLAAWRRSQQNKERKKSTRLLVELSLPLVGATDLDDWPGGIRQQFKAARPMVERMLSEIKRQTATEAAVDGTSEPFREAPRPTLWDDADAVVCFDSPRLACVVFPTPETLTRLDDLATAKEGEEGKSSMTIIVNPQWSLERGSQLVSDFGIGIGPWKAAREAKAASFERAFSLKSVRIRGDEARVWYSAAAEDAELAYSSSAGEKSASESGGEGRQQRQQQQQQRVEEPTGPWNVFLSVAAGSMASSSRLIWSGSEEPSYSQLELLLKSKGNVASKGWLERAQSEAKFLKDSL